MTKRRMKRLADDIRQEALCVTGKTMGEVIAGAKVLDPEVKGKAAQGYLWFYSKPGGYVFL